MPSLDFEVYCGICGSGCCSGTDVDRKNRVTVTCDTCQSKIEELEKAIDHLKEELEKESIEIANNRIFNYIMGGK